MSHTLIPDLDEKIFLHVLNLKNTPAVSNALDITFNEVDFSMQEQIDLCEIPAPTFEEATRANEIAQRMKQYGLTDVHIDEIGNRMGWR